jgi:hypothetical protein
MFDRVLVPTPTPSLQAQLEFYHHGPLGVVERQTVVRRPILPRFTSGDSGGYKATS